MVVKVIIGTRGSKLALYQANRVSGMLSTAYNDIVTEIMIIKTEGDIRTDVSLSEIGGKGLFVNKLERALENGVIDIAVHSMKDVPGDMNEDQFVIPCVLERGDCRDVFISKHALSSIQDIPDGFRVGTSSPRRMNQLYSINSKINIFPCRGNVTSRINKIENGEYDLIILAAAGIERLNLTDKISGYIDTSVMLPAATQAIIGVQCLKDNQTMIERLSALNHQKTYICNNAERAFVKTMNGSCTTPLAALCQYTSEYEIHLRCMYAKNNELFYTSHSGLVNQAVELGESAGNDLLPHMQDSTF